MPSVKKKDPDDLSRDALIHLSNAIIKGDSDYTLEQVLTEAKQGGGTLYTIETDKTIGAMYLQKYPDALHIVLLGGDSILTWKKDLTKFLRDTAKEEGVNHICVLGRKGWHGLFSELIPIGTLYVADLRN
jgi:hypothetical protein